MGFIYKVTCKVNGKVYIGKTDFSVEERWKRHLRMYDKDSCKNFKFYKALNKYGPENFTIEVVEQTEDTNERERFWIASFNSYKYGYNSTLGGEGNSKINRATVFELYQSGKSVTFIAEQLACSKSSVSSILRSEGFEPIFDTQKLSKKKIIALDREPKILKLYHEGLPSKDIATELSVNVPIIQKFLKARGLSPNKKPVITNDTKPKSQKTIKPRKCKYDTEGVLNLHNQGLSPVLIGEELTIPTGTVKSILKRLGLTANQHISRSRTVDHTAILRLHNEGNTVVEISKITLFGVKAIRASLTAQGLIENKINTVKNQYLNKILTLHSEGCSPHEISTALNISKSSVSQLIRENGLTPNKLEIKRTYQKFIHADEILRLYAMGLSTIEIADNCPCDKETIRRFLNENNLVPHNTRKRKVLCVELDITFNSIKEAAEFVCQGSLDKIKHTISGICSVCTGRRKTSSGYCWKYV